MSATASNLPAAWTDSDVAAEMLWVAREAQALSGQRQPSRPWTPEAVDAETRWAQYLTRKRALLEYFEQETISEPNLCDCAPPIQQHHRDTCPYRVTSS